MKSFEILEISRIKDGTSKVGTVFKLMSNGKYSHLDKKSAFNPTLEEFFIKDFEYDNVASGHFAITKIRLNRIPLAFTSTEFSIGDRFVDGQVIESFTRLKNGSLEVITKDEPKKQKPVGLFIGSGEVPAAVLAALRNSNKQAFCYDWLKRSEEEFRKQQIEKLFEVIDPLSIDSITFSRMMSKEDFLKQYPVRMEDVFKGNDDLITSMKSGMWPIDFLIPKKPLFTTTDGKDIFHGDKYFHVISDGTLQEEIAQGAGRDQYATQKGIKRFASKAAGEFWLKENAFKTYDGVLILDHNTLVYYVNEKSPYTVSFGDLYAKTKKGYWSKSIVFSTEEAAESYIENFKIENTKLFSYNDIIEHVSKLVASKSSASELYVEAGKRLKKVL